MSTDNRHFIEKLFAKHSSGLVRFLSRKLNNPDDAEDIAQNAFIRIQRMSNPDQLDNIKGYLYQTAANLAIDKIRREKLHNNYLQHETTKLANGSAEFANECTPERVLIAQRQLRAMQATLDALPAKSRQAFLLHRNHDMTYSEIAREMSVSVSSVEKYILQALKLFRKSLVKEGGNDQW